MSALVFWCVLGCGIAAALLVYVICRMLAVSGERVALMRPVSDAGRLHIEHMLKEGFSVAQIVRELHVSRGLVLAVMVQMETEGKR